MCFMCLGFLKQAELLELPYNETLLLSNRRKRIVGELFMNSG